MATPVIETSSTFAAIGTAVSLGQPSGLAVGDMLVVMVASELGNANNWPDGSTLTDAYNDLQAQHGNNSADVQIHVYWRIATGTETWPLTVTEGSNNDKVAWCLRISNHNDTVPTIGAWSGEDTTGSTLVVGSITPASGDLIIAFTGTDGSDLTPATINSGTGYTVDDTLEQPANNANGVGASYATKTADGAASALTFGYGASDGRMGVQFAISQSAAANVTETIPNGSLTLTGVAPLTSITGHVRESIPNSTLVLTSFAPNASAAANITEQIPSGTLTLTGVAPLDSITGHVRESIPGSTLNLTPFAPLDSITGHVRESIPSASLTLLANAPLDYQTGHVRESIPSHTLTLTGLAPNAYQPTENTTELIPAGTLTITGFAPATDIVPGATEQIPASSLTLTGFAPTDYVTGHVRESVPRGTLTLTGVVPNAAVPTDSIVEPVPNNVIQLSSYVPTVTNTGAAPAPTVERPTGGISKRVKQRKRRQIMVDGKLYTIEHPEQELRILQAFLDKIQNKQILDLQKKKVPAVKRKIKLNAKTITRTENRINKVQERIKWLRKQDQEILALLAA